MKITTKTKALNIDLLKFIFFNTWYRRVKHFLYCILSIRSHLSKIPSFGLDTWFELSTSFPLNAVMLNNWPAHFHCCLVVDTRTFHRRLVNRHDRLTNHGIDRSASAVANYLLIISQRIVRKVIDRYQWSKKKRAIKMYSPKIVHWK